MLLKTGVADQPKPVLVVVAGPNGSGKTTLTTELFKHQWLKNCEYINADNVAKDTFGDWNSPEASLKAAIYTTTQRERLLLEGRSMVFETVFSATDKVDFLKNARSQGFFVRLIFVGTDHPKINASRVAQRVMEGGHDVPITKIIDRYSKSIANCLAAALFVDRAYIYDNSTDGQAPQLLFRTMSGEITKTYNNEHPWAQTIASGLRACNDFENQQQNVLQPKD